MNKALFIMLAGTVAAASAMAQATGGAPAGGATSGGATTGGGTPGGTTGTTVPGNRFPTTTNPGQQQPQQQQPSFDLPRPIFLSGKVVMDDGTPVPSNVVIQKVCNGQPRNVAYTDSRGNFSFQWDQQNGMMLDASQSTFGDSGFGQQSRNSRSGMGNSSSSMAGCELRADLAGYRSDLINLFNRQAMDNPDVGRVVLHRMGNVEGLSISATSFMAPKDAKKAYEKGLQFMLKSKPEDAMKEFEKAVTAYPKYADAWVNIGKIRVAQKNAEGGREAMLKAIDADSKLVAPHIELGMMAARENKWAEAAPYLERGLKLDPVDYPTAWYANAAANYNLKKWDDAEKNVREAIKLDPKHVNPRSQYLLGLILSEKHDYPGAAEQFKSYLKLAPNAPDTEVVKDQIGQIEKFLKESVEASK